MPDAKHYLESHYTQFSTLIVLTSKIEISHDDPNL